ncbi:energy transducer TonB [Hymenobacter sp. HSC-4F20]|uniref:energy transducer TonB n=1 Tax=Hymenobacter sp. HSC-4F20 TaxID=2864135 RepID=UPI001C736EA8|nr:energy transducer TonB [Hymenobacter sp. HSC-4F20]MBX0289551.1 energy transducer TonB [Hymenobacter sp. HSC-4F20]
MKYLLALAVVLTLSMSAAAQQPVKTFYLDYGFQEIFVNDDVAYLVDRHITGPGRWTDSVFTVANSYLREVVHASIRSQGDTSFSTTRWQPNGLVQWREEKLGKRQNGTQLYYDQAGRLRHRHQYVAGIQKSTECVSATGTPEACHYAEEIAQYPAGMPGLLSYVAQHLHYPMDALASRIQGKVLVYFVVDEEGQVRNIRVKNSLFPSLDAESMRVVKQLSRFAPGRKAGLTVPTRYAVPVTFSIN